MQVLTWGFFGIELPTLSGRIRAQAYTVRSLACLRPRSFDTKWRHIDDIYPVLAYKLEDESLLLAPAHNKHHYNRYPFHRMCLE